MNRHSKGKALAFEQLEDRTLMASDLINSVLSSVRQIQANAGLARQEVLSSVNSTTSQIVSLSNSISQAISTNASEIAAAAASGNSAALQLQLQDAQQLQSDLQQVALSQAAAAQALAQTNVQIAQQVSQNTRAVINQLISTLRSGGTTIDPSTIVSQQLANLSQITSSINSTVDAIVQQALDAEANALTLINNFVPTTPSTPSSSISGVFTGSFSLQTSSSTTPSSSFLGGILGNLFGAPSVTGTLTINVANVQGSMLGTVTGGNILLPGSNGIPTFSAITGGSVSLAMLPTPDSDGFTIEGVANLQVGSQTVVFDFGANLVAGRLIIGKVFDGAIINTNSTLITGGNVTLVQT